MYHPNYETYVNIKSKFIAHYRHMTAFKVKWKGITSKNLKNRPQRKIIFCLCRDRGNIIHLEYVKDKESHNTQLYDQQLQSEHICLSKSLLLSLIRTQGGIQQK